jgi:hypothetical protein
MRRYKGQLIGGGRTAECVVELSPRGIWTIDEVTPSTLPQGSYALTFGDRHEKNPGGIYKRGEARRATKDSPDASHEPPDEAAPGRPQ